MRIVCTGGRDYEDDAMVFDVLLALKPESVHVGDCPTGLDRTVRDFCKSKRIPVRIYEADWKTHGKAAGPIRNRHMVEMAGPDAVVIAFPGGKGTESCVAAARGLNRMILRVER